MSSIRQALKAKDVLPELHPGEWLLNANLLFEQGATLLIGRGILNNVVYVNEHNGISLYTDAKQNIVYPNTIYGNARYGVYIKSSGNHVNDNTTHNNHDDNIHEWCANRMNCVPHATTEHDSQDASALASKLRNERDLL